MTAEDAAAVQAQETGAHTKDLYAAIDRGEFPEWDLAVQLMDDHDHPELNWDPLDDTKTWPENDFPLHHIGTLQLNRTPANFFAESEQLAFGTGVLVDGLDFSDDKMLVGRTFSYSDTQRHRVGPNYLQLPVNAPKGTTVRTNQRDGQMDFRVDEGHENLTVNYEPSTIGGLRQAAPPAHRAQGPTYNAQLTREQIERTNDYEQPGQRFQLSEPWEQDDLVANLTGLFEQCDRHIQERMIWHLFLCDDELGRRVGEGIGISAADVRHLEPLATQGWGPDEQRRLDSLGENGPRDVAGLVMTHCVPNERVAVADGDRDFVGAG